MIDHSSSMAVAALSAALYAVVYVVYTKYVAATPVEWPYVAKQIAQIFAACMGGSYAAGYLLSPLTGSGAVKVFTNDPSF
jgi:hypothetical protein